MPEELEPTRGKVEHYAVLEIWYESDPGWEAANEWVQDLGDMLMFSQGGIIEVNAHVDPQIRKDRQYQQRIIDA